MDDQDDIIFSHEVLVRAPPPQTTFIDFDKVREYLETQRLAMARPGPSAQAPPTNGTYENPVDLSDDEESPTVIRAPPTLLPGPSSTVPGRLRAMVVPARQAPPPRQHTVIHHQVPMASLPGFRTPIPRQAPPTRGPLGTHEDPLELSDDDESPTVIPGPPSTVPSRLRAMLATPTTTTVSGMSETPRARPVEASGASGSSESRIRLQEVSGKIQKDTEDLGDMPGTSGGFALAPELRMTSSEARETSTSAQMSSEALTSVRTSSEAAKSIRTPSRLTRSEPEFPRSKSTSSEAPESSRIAPASSEASEVVLTLSEALESDLTSSETSGYISTSSDSDPKHSETTSESSRSHSESPMSSGPSTSTQKTSTSSDSEAMDVDEPQKKSNKRKSIKPWTGIFQDQVLHFDRGVHPPNGIHRNPYSFANAQSSAKPMKTPEKLRIQGKSAKNPLELDLNFEEKGIIGECRLIHIGEMFQADVSKIPFYDQKNVEEYYANYPDSEQEILKPLDEEKCSKNFKTIHEQYWRPIFLQFRNQIPYEVALEHLKLCNFNLEIALDTVDQKLKDVAQELKPLCTAQALKLAKMMKSGRNSMRRIQEQALRNYHIGEVKELVRDFEKLYVHQPRNGVACTCYSMAHMEAPVVPRICCVNCNRSYRNPAQRARKPADPKEWCLICQAYFAIAKKRRPANNVVFTGREIKFLNTWNRKEAELGKKLTRAQVEAQILKENEQRWKRLELTEEEEEMVNGWDLEFIEDSKTLGEKLTSMLRPFEIPHFTKCQCFKNGGVTRRSENFGKWSWSTEEQRKWKEIIVKEKGDTVKISKVFGVETGLVERFLKVHPKKNLTLKPRPLHPHLDLPPVLPIDEFFGTPKLTQAQLRQQRSAKRARNEQED